MRQKRKRLSTTSEEQAECNRDKWLEHLATSTEADNDVYMWRWTGTITKESFNLLNRYPFHMFEIVDSECWLILGFVQQNDEGQAQVEILTLRPGDYLIVDIETTCHLTYQWNLVKKVNNGWPYSV